MSEQINLDELYELDDDLQAEVEQLEANLLELLPGKDGFVPTKLAPDPTDEEEEAGVREVWWQTEIAEVRRVSFWPHEYEGGGHKVNVEFRITHGPNEGRVLSRAFYMYAHDRERQARALTQINKLLKAAQINELPTGENGKPSVVKGLEALAGRPVKLRVMQGYQHPWDAEARRANTAEPKTFRQRISDFSSI